MWSAENRQGDYVIRISHTDKSYKYFFTRIFKIYIRVSRRFFREQGEISTAEIDVKTSYSE